MFEFVKTDEPCCVHLHVKRRVVMPKDPHFGLVKLPDRLQSLLRTRPIVSVIRIHQERQDAQRRIMSYHDPWLCGLYHIHELMELIVGALFVIPPINVLRSRMPVDAERTTDKHMIALNVPVRNPLRMTSAHFRVIVVASDKPMATVPGHCVVWWVAVRLSVAPDESYTEISDLNAGGDATDQGLVSTPFSVNVSDVPHVLRPQPGGTQDSSGQSCYNAFIT